MFDYDNDDSDDCNDAAEEDYKDCEFFPGKADFYCVYHLSLLGSSSNSLDIIIC
jgi:hypothetical protein